MYQRYVVVLAMTNYLSRFIPQFSTLTEPLRVVTRQDVKWYWGQEQYTAFDKLRQELSSDTVMAYFDPKE